jgi:hypothetical protein
MTYCHSYLSFSDRYAHIEYNRLAQEEESYDGGTMEVESLAQQQVVGGNGGGGGAIDGGWSLNDDDNDDDDAGGSAQASAWSSGRGGNKR